MTDPEPGAASHPSRASSQVSRELLYQGLFEHAPVEVHVWALVRDDQGQIRTWRLVDANPAALASWGHALVEIAGKTTEEIFPGADPVTTFLPIVADIMRTGRPNEWQVSFAGTGQILQMVSIPVGDYFISTGFDVTADRKREADLRDALESLNQATKAGGVGLWDWDLQTDRVRYSDEWKRQLGYAPDEISDGFEEWRSRVHPDDLPHALERVRIAIADPAQGYNVSFRMRHKDGVYRWILAQSSITRDASGRALRMLGSHVDITERRRLEEQASAAQKLEAIGTLAAGIAHDFNNLLGAITGNLSLLRDLLPAAEEPQVLLRELEHAAAGATTLTRQLLTFAKGGSPLREVVSVHELVVEAATFVTRGSSTQCVFQFPDDLRMVEADVGQLGQVVNNLVINAMQAMPQGGVVHLTGANLTLTEPNEWGLPAGPYVKLSVADEGTGIPPEILPRIFDPFFTTKPTGSGLGLSSSYAIVSRHGGRITVRSTVGTGTVFDILLPASAGAPHPKPAPQVLAGQGRILLMDDESAIRRLFQRMLARLGYECDVVANGEEALGRYGDAMRAGRRYDAVILDLTIPGHRSGVEVLRTLHALDPRVVAIVASGYADDDALAHYTSEGFRGRLQKPVDLATLSTEVARVLAEARGTVGG